MLKSWRMELDFVYRELIRSLLFCYCYDLMWVKKLSSIIVQIINGVHLLWTDTRTFHSRSRYCTWSWWRVTEKQVQFDICQQTPSCWYEQGEGFQWKNSNAANRHTDCNSIGYAAIACIDIHKSYSRSRLNKVWCKSLRTPLDLMFWKWYNDCSSESRSRGRQYGINPSKHFFGV